MRPHFSFLVDMTGEQWRYCHDMPSFIANVYLSCRGKRIVEYQSGLQWSGVTFSSMRVGR